MQNGYAMLCSLDAQVRADTLESVYGFSPADFEKELAFAMGMTDLNDVDSIRWLMALLNRRVAELGS